MLAYHLVVGSAYEYFAQPFAGEARASEIRYYKGGDSAHHRRCLGCALHLPVYLLIREHGAENLRISGVAIASVGIATGSAYIHPVAVICVGRALSGGAEGAHGNHFVVHRGLGFLPAVVACGENNEAAFHGAGLVALLVGSGIADEIIDSEAIGVGRGGRNVMQTVVFDIPTVVEDDCSVIRRPDNGVVWVAAVPIIRSDALTVQDAYSASSVLASGDAANAFAIVVYAGDDACHVGAVPLGLDIIRIGGCGAQERFAAVGAGGDDHSGQVGMGVIYAGVHNSNNHVAAPGGEIVPDRNYVDVGFFSEFGEQCAVVEEMPLAVSVWIVEGDAVWNASGNALEVEYSGDGCQFPFRPGEGDLLVPADEVQAVKPGGTVALFELRVLWNHPFQPISFGKRDGVIFDFDNNV